MLYNLLSMGLDAAVELIQTNHEILCVSHVGPDGDAVGSLLGMYWILRQLGKNPAVALQDDVPFELKWLPGVDQIGSTRSTNRTFDLIISLDASSPDRMGSVIQPQVHHSIPLLVIDHHVTNTNFGNVNWVDGQSAATCQMLVELAERLAVPLSKEAATCLLTGVVTDTLCFRTSNTTAAVLMTATKLMQCGAQLTEITQRTLDLRPYNALRLAGHAMINAELEGGVLWTKVTRQQALETGAEPGQANLSSILSRTVEADITAIFTEKFDNKGLPVVDCSFRAKPGFDVGAVAFELGGGGHRPAAGCTLPGSLANVVPDVVRRLQKARQAALVGQKK